MEPLQQKPEVFCGIHSISDKLCFYAEIQITFGTV